MHFQISLLIFFFDLLEKNMLLPGAQDESWGSSCEGNWGRRTTPKTTQRRIKTPGASPGLSCTQAPSSNKALGSLTPSALTVCTQILLQTLNLASWLHQSLPEPTLSKGYVHSLKSGADFSPLMTIKLRQFLVSFVPSVHTQWGTLSFRRTLR